ncbi:hypothetical protein Aau02nite_41550 [Amorphoplanes auranticolor]|uniref:Uncharacterized protein n=1 Tax=Actinoplanes auranticolor TaxID=47988 RepID=A0A919SF45_9ACTN|nr:hypothetical protein Aau02nite_41550 [Actinoplanes auranticolor]
MGARGAQSERGEQRGADRADGGPVAVALGRAGQRRCGRDHAGNWSGRSEGSSSKAPAPSG